MIDFWVIGVLLLHLFVMLLLFLPALLVEGLQVLTALVLLHHLVPLELLVTLLVEILQILRGLDGKGELLTETEFSVEQIYKERITA